MGSSKQRATPGHALRLSRQPAANGADYRFGSGGLARPPLPDSGDDPEVSSGWTASDLLITSQVRTALALSRRVDGSAIRVEAVGGVVRLTGQVASQEEELAAVGLAESVWGVEEVISRLEIR